MAKLFSSRLEMLDEWALVRIAETAAVNGRAPKLLLAEKGDDGKVHVAPSSTKRNTGIVVDVGPGAVNAQGAVVPPDKRIKAGAMVLFPGKAAFQHPDFLTEMQEEGLFFVPASNLIAIVKP